MVVHRCSQVRRVIDEGHGRREARELILARDLVAAALPARSVASASRNHASDRPRARLKREGPVLALAQQPFAKPGLERNTSRFGK